MSFHVLSWVADHSPTKGAARLLLVMMADMANDEGEFYCTNKTLARRCRFTVRSLQINMKKLAEAGAIEIVYQVADSRRTLNNAYRIFTPGRAVPELRSKPPRAKVSSPSPDPRPDPPRAKVSSPSLPEETFALTPKVSSPSPRRNLRPHRETVNRNLQQKPFTEQHQQPRAREGLGETRPREEVEALRRNIQQLAERDGLGFDRVAIWVTSGRASGSPQCRGTLSFETMSEKHMRRSIVDSNTLLDPSLAPRQFRRIPL